MYAWQDIMQSIADQRMYSRYSLRLNCAHVKAD